uniref:Choline transporter-like protein n=1 Tax=Oncorhynchus tshawytscha TaxID=74940 RepID=A0A8C8HAK0_ONCTS
YSFLRNEANDAAVFCLVAAWIHGDPRKVVYPTDSHGQFCGQQGTPNANKAILFYFNILQCANPAVLINLQCPTTQLCVSKCPDRFATYLDMQYNYRYNKSYWEYYRQFCKPGFDNPRKVPRLMPPVTFLQRCFPDFITRNGTLTVANKTVFKDGLGKTRSVIDLRDAANPTHVCPHAFMHVFLYVYMFYSGPHSYTTGVFCVSRGLVITMVVSLAFILLLRFTAGVLLWLIIFGVIAVVGYGIWHCYWEFSTLRGKPHGDGDVTISDIGFQTDFRVYLQLSQTWLIFMISLSVIEAVIIIILIFLRRRVRIAIALLKEGSRAIGYIMSTLFYPIITFVLLAICIAYWAVTAVFLASSGDAVYKVMSTPDKCVYANLTCDPETFSQTNVTKVCPGSQCTFAFYGGESLYHRYIFVLQLCNLLVFLWLVNFTIALGQCTLAGAFASYYWALRKPQDIPSCPLFSSFSRAVRYHTGSLAFGSLILAVVQMFRIVLEYLDHKLKGAHNAFARFLICCLKCCFWCLEHFIKFMNRNAYIMIAIYGKNFCTSAKDAFFLLMRNVVRVAVLDKVTDFLLFLGKVLISGSVGVLAFFFFTRKIPVIQEEVPSLNYYWVPLLVRNIITSNVVWVSIACYGDIWILPDCPCGSAARPFYMSSTLRQILDKKNISLTVAKSCI